MSSNAHSNQLMRLFSRWTAAVAKQLTGAWATPVKALAKQAKQYTTQKKLAQFDADITKLGSQPSLLELAEAIKKLKADWARLSKTINKGDVE